MRVVAAVLVLGFLGLAGESVAQTTVLVRTAYLPPVGCSNSGCPTAVFEYDPDGRALRSTTPVAAGTSAYLTPDGSLLVAFDQFNPRLVVLDRTSGGDFVIPLSPSAVRVIGNPVRPEVYVNDAAGGLALAASGARRMNTPSCGSSVEARSVSADGRRVLDQCSPGNGNPGYSAVLDAARGAVVSVMPPGWSPVLNADGSALFQAVSSHTGMLLRRYLADSGALDVETVLAPSFIPPNMAFDPRSRRVFLWATSYSGVFDGVTLTKQTAAGCVSTVTDMAFERDRPRAFLVGYNTNSGGFGFDTGVFCEIDTTSLAVTAFYLYTNPRLGAQAIALAEAPPPPATLASQVTGSSVTLT